MILERIRRRRLLGVVDGVANKCFVLAHEVVSRSARPTLCKARHEVWRLLRDDYEFSYNEIASLFDRDHTTVSSGIKAARKRIEAKQRQNGQS